MTERANPAPLAFAALALTLFLYSIFNASWYPMSGFGVAVPVAVAYGGAAMMIAGIMGYGRGQMFGAAVYLSIGALWLSLALFWLFLRSGVTAPVTAWFFILWAAVVLCAWLGALRQPLAPMLVFLGFWITLALVAVGDWGVSGATVVGGYTGLVTAVIAFYVAAAYLLRDAAGKPVLPFVASA